jgi:hypothetical protein
MPSETDRAIVQLFTKELVVMGNELILTFPSVELRITARKRNACNGRKAKLKFVRRAEVDR